ncbi:sensor histidine kinase [Amycolatopsis eburnea]|uniref:histidine kinase n=1 Tax=Amycolatopsis eburnea TaxID=2267691 RepID=A0A3R9E6J9_9PSEU|nr:sensor histidine kinase [Amycolatopsis eburnea]RSD21830.1 two-component sensor histidine kinase [Amycolatopsis eburnea]
MIERALARWRRFDVAVRDTPLAVLFLAAAFLPVVQNHGTQLGGLPQRPFDALAFVAVGFECLPLALRRRWPGLCVTLVSLGFALDQLRGYHSVSGAALAVALMSAGAHLGARRRITALLLSVAYTALAIVLFRLGTDPVEEYVTFFLLLVFAWGLGAWLRATRTAEAERRRRVAEDTRAAERARIARELHDVVTHHVTAMVVQAEAARYLTAAPERLGESLTAITGTGRRAIADLRHLLDLLNPDHGPGIAPPPGGLRALVDHAIEAGQPVEFAEEGTPSEAAGSADLVAYRVVQEALTNALKHARGCRTSVRVRHGEQEIEVAVGTEGPGSASPGGSGRGLAGLRERVGVLGGDFSAGPHGAAFVVRARIPTGARA